MPDIECDVLIVGSGIGGLTAALAARMAGLDTLVIEQDLLVGGPSSLSSGMLWLPNSPLMRHERVHDSRATCWTTSPTSWPKAIPPPRPSVAPPSSTGWRR